VRLIAPEDTKYMYASNRFDQGTMSSQMDVDRFDAQRFPLFDKARKYRVIIDPGGMLFIPRGSWHYVRSLDKSMSVRSMRCGSRRGYRHPSAPITNCVR